MRLAAILATLLLLAGCEAEPDGSVFQGYVEGEFVKVAPETGGRIVDLASERGDRVKEGALLFRLDAAEAEAAVAQAEAELARAAAQLENLLHGQRPPELAVLEAEIAEAVASLDTARKDMERQESLFERRVISEARLDQADEAVSIAAARLASAERRRDVAALPARTPEIEAGERGVDAARAGLVQAETRLANHSVAAPAAGVIEDVYYEAGEVVSAGAPVLLLLPPDGRKVIFFVPEPGRPRLPLGSEVAIACDGCPGELTARVAFLSHEAEFTPPVIFSRDTRQKLVFRAEAALVGEAAAALPLGQPVDVSRVEGASP